MSKVWAVVRAVQASRLERRLRFLAVTLATFASDDGTNVRPGIRRLMQALGLKRSAVRAGLKELMDQDHQILIPTGFHHHTRVYRFDLARLATYEPSPAAAKPTKQSTRLDSSTVQPAGIKSPAPWRQQSSALASTVRHAGVIDLHDQQDHQEGTGADAPAPPFHVYAAIAGKALAAALAEGDGSDANTAEHMRLLEAQQGIPHNPDMDQKALRAARNVQERHAKPGGRY